MPQETACTSLAGTVVHREVLHHMHGMAWLQHLAAYSPAQSKANTSVTTRHTVHLAHAPLPWQQSAAPGSGLTRPCQLPCSHPPAWRTDCQTWLQTLQQPTDMVANPVAANRHGCKPCSSQQGLLHEHKAAKMHCRYRPVTWCGHSLERTAAEATDTFCIVQGLCRYTYIKNSHRAAGAACKALGRHEKEVTSAVIAQDMKPSRVVVCTCRGLLFAPGCGVLYHVGGISQGPVCSHAVFLPPPQLTGVHLIGVSSQIMTCIETK